MYEEALLPICPRTAVSEDTPEILRLVAQVYWDMHAVYGGPEPKTDAHWESLVAASLDRRLGDDVAAFVVEDADGKICSLAVGRLSETLPSPRRLHVLEGYIEWVGTDRQRRGRGYATAATETLLDWFRSRGALSVSVHASKVAESLYVRLGFDDGGPRGLSIRLAAEELPDHFGGIDRG